MREVRRRSCEDGRRKEGEDGVWREGGDIKGYEEILAKRKLECRQREEQEEQHRLERGRGRGADHVPTKDFKASRSLQFAKAFGEQKQHAHLRAVAHTSGERRVLKKNEKEKREKK